MKHTLLVCSAALAAPLLQGCSNLPEKQMPRAWRVEPVFSTSNSPMAAEGYYALGRYHAGMQRWAQAVQDYQRAIASSPTHVEAHNALGVALAQQGRYVEALDTLRKAVALAPQRSHLHNNLGRVQMLVGQEREAAVSLKAALVLEPGNESARENLRVLLLRTQGQQPTMRAETDAPPAPAVKPAAAPSAAPAKQVAAPALATLQIFSTPTAPAMTVRSEDVARDRIVSAVVAAPSLAEQQRESPRDLPKEVAQPTRPPRLEISNGNGITGFAMLVRRWLGQQGWTTQRLTNERPYRQVQTVVQYRTGFEHSAERLAQELPGSARLDPSSELRSDVDVRVVLGRDAQVWALCLKSRLCRPEATVAMKDSTSR